MTRTRFNRLNRRSVLMGATALGALGAAGGGVLARQSGAAVVRNARSKAGSLPGQRNLLIRGANVLTMDEKLGDFATGDVHVRNGVIVAVGAKARRAAGAPVIEAAA